MQKVFASKGRRGLQAGGGAPVKEGGYGIRL